MLGQAFDGKMIFTMKVILSYFERKQDRILSDYLYYLCIPLIVKDLKLFILIIILRKPLETLIISCILQST